MSLVVVVSGGPGAGKTTLAPALAAELGLPLVAKDTIKEALGEALCDDRPPRADLDLSRRLGAAAFEVLYALLPGTAPVVAEAYWHVDMARPRLAGLGLEVVEVFCRCPMEVLESRFADRARRGDRHWVHGGAELRIEPPEPLAIGPVLEVDSSRTVDVVQVARWVQDQRHGR